MKVLKILLKAGRYTTGAFLLLAGIIGVGSLFSSPASADTASMSADNIELTAKDKTSKKTPAEIRREKARKKRRLLRRIARYFKKQMDTTYKDLAKTAKTSEKIQLALYRVMDNATNVNTFKKAKESIDIDLKQLDRARENILIEKKKETNNE